MTTGDMDRPDRPSEGDRPGAVDDAVWTELVASFHASTADRPGRWPDAENLPGDPPAPPQGPTAPSRVVRPASRPDQEQDADAPPSAPPAVTWTAAGPRDWDPPYDPDEDGFVPPPPPPLPELGVPTKAAWLAGLGGPGYLTLATLLHWSTPQWAALLCVLAGVIGFGYLVSRLKDRPDDGDDDPDDFGAVV